MVHLTGMLFGRMIRHRAVSSLRKPDKFWKKHQLFRMTWRFHSRPRNIYKLAVTSGRRAMMFSFLGRKHKKIFHQDLWKIRINAGALEHGLTYEQFTDGLSASHILINKKVLAELSMYEPRTFKSLAQVAKQHYVEQGICIDGLTPPVGIVTRGMLNTPIVPGNKNLYPY